MDFWRFLRNIGRSPRHNREEEREAKPGSNVERNRWAILIGVDYYMKGDARPGIMVPNLEGCVQDVRNVERYLLASSNIQPRRIYTLTATAPKPKFGRNEPVEPSDRWPTYENIVRTFREITETAEPNDLVYIHYSGHGARVMTIFGDLKRGEGGLKEAVKSANVPENISDDGHIEDDGFDNALVPTNIACEGGRYLRDVEIAHLLREMTEKKLVVTLVLDCGYVTGSSREAITMRSIWDKKNKLESDTSIFSQEELIAAYNERVPTGDKSRGHSLLEWQGYTLLAACSESRAAAERRFGDDKVQGIFTRSLIDTLISNSDLTYDQLRRQVSDRVRNTTGYMDGVVLRPSGEARNWFFHRGD